jgi:ribosomal protein L7/L12
MLHEMLGGFIFWIAVLGVPIIWISLAKINGAVNGLNRKLDMLMKHSGMNVQELANREALVLVKAGQKIEAIKLYREISGASLAEAKAAVDKLQEGAGPA